MLKDLRHSTIKEALLFCGSMGIGKSTESVMEWAKFMGLPDEYWTGTQNHIIGNHIANAGKKINSALGYDYIAEHFPNWAKNSRYSAT
jgi:hypothetical protein